MNVEERETPHWLGRLLPGYGENRPLLGYVAGVVGLSLLCLISQASTFAHLLSWSILLWFLANLAAELLWLETGSGDATDSMAMTVNLATLMLVGPHASWIIGASVLLATRVFQKRDWFRSLFAFGQIVATAHVAGTLFRWVHPDPVTLEAMRSSLMLYLAMFACGTSYFLVNTWLVTGAIRFEKKQPFWTIWRKNFAFRNSIVSSVGLFSLSPLVNLSFLAIGYPGLAMFFLPLTLIKNQNRDYVNLQKLHESMISTERMAAKGEMAASVAHEINNILAVLGARAQMIQAYAQHLGEDKLTASTDVIRQQIQRMATMAKGLMAFSHAEVKMQSIDLNRLVLETVEFVRPQNAYDRIEIISELQPDLGVIEADPGQLNQVLINLMKNAADAINEHTERDPGDPPIIRVTTSRGKGGMRIAVHDNGPGMPPAVRAKVFEPHFTTKKTGHGFGLATCYRILENHGGAITVESEVGKGTVFTLRLPKKSETTGERSAENEEVEGLPGEGDSQAGEANRTAGAA